MFFDVNQHHCPLEFIGLPTAVLYREQLEVLLPFLRSRPAPCKLSVDSGCVGLVIRASETGVRIGSLKIVGQRIHNEDVERLLSTENSIFLLELEFHSGRLTRRGYDAFARFLGREDAAIRKIDFGRTSPMNIDNAQMLLRSIPSCSTLRHIDLGRLYHHGDEVSYHGALQVLKDLICDRSNFDALCRSNHQLRHIGRDPGARIKRSKIIQEALEINGRRGRSVNQKCRSKLRAFYFRGEFDTRPFADMDVVYMPDVLELATMSEELVLREKEGRAERGTYVTARNGHLGGTYRLVRNCHLPELFRFPSREVEMDRLRTENSKLESTVRSLKQKIDWMNDRLLYVCASPSYHEPNKRLKRKAK